MSNELEQVAQRKSKLSELVAPDGFLIVSGFMDSEKAAVVTALEKFLIPHTIAHAEEWLCAVFTKPA